MPDGPSPAASSLAPKPENSTLASERFMALAISSVSSEPAAPTTVPAMIIAALPSTKPSKATAKPVRALYSEITTGISAPPIGVVMKMPSTSAIRKNTVIQNGPGSTDVARARPMPNSRMTINAFSPWCIGADQAFFINPWSLA